MPELDAIDRSLLEMLQNDADLTLSALGEAVGLSGPAVQRRLARHRSTGLIRRTAAQLDPEAAGIGVTVLTFVRLDRDHGRAVETLHRRLAEHPHVQQCYELAGHYDLALIVVAADMLSYRAIVAELLDRDPNVRRFASHVALQTVKATLAVPIG